MTMEKIAYLNALRLFATFAVVVLHSSATYLDNGLYTEDNHNAFGFYNNINAFAVPVFVMISGALFLNPKKETGYRILFQKYVRRIALALLVFGLPMCVAESVFTGAGWGGVIPNFLTGHSWNHMWYLYMLIGLYLMTPILKPFMNGSSRNTILIAFAILFAMSSVLPIMERYGIQLKGWMVLKNNPYLLLYMMGFYLAAIEKFKMKLWVIWLSLLFCIMVIVYKLMIGIDYMLYYDPISILLAATIFMLFKQLNVKWEIADRLAPYCFGIYLVHTFFLNALAKVFHISPVDYMEAWISIPMLGCLTFWAALFVSYLMRMIPVLRKYIL